MTEKEIMSAKNDIVKMYYKVKKSYTHIELYFDTFSELVEKNLGNNDVDKLNNILFEKLEEAFFLIPKKQLIHLIIHIKDYGEYLPEEASKILRANLRLKAYGIATINNEKKHMSLFLLIGGMCGLIFSAIVSKWLPDIVNEILNIGSTVFIWEALINLIIERNEDRRKLNHYLKQLRRVEMRLTGEEKAKPVLKKNDIPTKKASK